MDNAREEEKTEKKFTTLFKIFVKIKNKGGTRFRIEGNYENDANVMLYLVM